MVETARSTDFAQFLEDFAEAIELAAAGELEDAEEAIADARQAAVNEARADFTSTMAATYRYDVAARVLSRRYKETGRR